MLFMKTLFLVFLKSSNDNMKKNICLFSSWVKTGI